jgi:hypothetical protein
MTNNSLESGTNNPGVNIKPNSHISPLAVFQGLRRTSKVGAYEKGGGGGGLCAMDKRERGVDSEICALWAAPKYFSVH